MFLLSSPRLFAVLSIPYFLLLHVSADTCSDVQSKRSEITVLYPNTPNYDITVAEHWSRGCSALKPSCILLPRTAQQVSDIIKILNANDEKFAVRSGGHSPNKFFASIANGPLIATKLLNEVVYNKEAQTVRIGPGNRWHNVTYALKGTGMNVVGGRIGEVGVGGYLLGGGLSFMSAEHGWGANNIVEADVVLADASIVKASNTSNPELFAALKGGGSNFGVVTSFTMRAIPQGKVWGGVRTYFGGKSPELLAAIRDFTEYNTDPKAGIIPTAELTGYGLVDIWVVFMYYNGPTPPPEVFANFTKIASTIDLTKTCDYHDLVVFNNNYVVKNSLYTIATETMPLPNSTVGAEVMNEMYNTWHKIAASVQSVPGIVVSIAWQPLPKMIARKAQENGGMVLNMDDSVDRIIIELDYSYWRSSDEDFIDKTTVQTYSALGDKVQQFIKAKKLPEAHLPLFMNDMYFRQDYWGRLNTTAAFKNTQKRMDPTAFWTKRTTGFSL